MKKLLLVYLLAATFHIIGSIGSGPAVEIVLKDHQPDQRDLPTASRLQVAENDNPDATTICCLRKGDVFEGDVDILEKAHNPARLRLYIEKVGSLDSDENGIEAIAEMNIHNTRVIYGLHGVYVPSYRQIYLQEIVNIDQALASNNVIVNKVLFEPVGLAGEITTDGHTIHCNISYNGNASLVRIDQKSKVDETLSAIHTHDTR